MDEPVLTVQEALEAVLGEYAPIERTYDVTRTECLVVGDAVEQVTYTETVTEQLPNWSWFGSLFVFCLFLYCFMRSVGGLLKCKI